MTGESALIHIGTHKTGSTAFQIWAAEARSDLAAKANIEYYRGMFSPSHAEFPMLCLARDRNMPMRVRTPDWCLPEWRAEAERYIGEQVVGPAKSLLISSEALSYVRQKSEVERLVDLLRPRRLSVVAVLRDRMDYLQSYRRTMESLGFPPSSFPRSFAYVEDDSWLLDYDALLAPYRTVLGSAQVNVISYEETLRRYGSVIPGILDAWDVEEGDIPHWDRYTPSAKKKHRLFGLRGLRSRL